LQESQISVYLSLHQRPAGVGSPIGRRRVESQKSQASNENEVSATEKGITLNFKVSPEFKKEFKGFAVAQGISMTDLLKEGFALSKKGRGQ
jgi:hypothetical protein